MEKEKMIFALVESENITADVWVDGGEIQTENEEAYWTIFRFLDLLGIDFTSGEPEEEGELYYIYFD